MTFQFLSDGKQLILYFECQISLDFLKRTHTKL